MVAGGLSYKGMSKLIFITGTMTSFSYKQALKLYKEDIEPLDPPLHLQKDNGSSDPWDAGTGSEATLPHQNMSKFYLQ